MAQVSVEKLSKLEQEQVAAAFTLELAEQQLKEVLYNPFARVRNINHGYQQLSLPEHVCHVSFFSEVSGCLTLCFVI